MAESEILRGHCNTNILGAGILWYTMKQYYITMYRDIRSTTSRGRSACQKQNMGGTCKITDGQSPSWRSPSIVLRCGRKRSYLSLRFKSAGVVRSNGKRNWRVSYEEAIADNIKYWWAEDNEI